MSSSFVMRIASITRTASLQRFQFQCPLFSSRVLYSAKPGGKRESDKKLVYLLDADGKHLGTKTLVDAENIAKKNKLLLVCSDSATKYPTYKLELKSSQTEDLEAVVSGEKHVRNKETTSSKNQKVVKNLVLTTKVTNHDLNVKLDSAKKWLLHGSEVKVVVTGEKNMFDKMFAEISGLLKDFASFKQKQIGNNLKFICVPKISDSTLTTHSEPIANSESTENSGDVEMEDPNEIINRELQQLLNSNEKINKV